MPRKAKDKVLEVLENTVNSKENLVVTTKKKVATKNDGSKKKTSTQKENPKKEATKKSTTATTRSSSKTTKSKTSTSKSKVATSKSTKSQTTPKTKTSTAKTKASASNQNSSTTKSKESKASTSKSNKATTKSSKLETPSIVEYYDLPSQYEYTVVKILAQTPTILFVYWDISSADRQNLINYYGENFFYETSPFLLVKNKTKNYEFEVEINDYANSWYLHIPESNCEYEVILMRRNKNSHIILENNGNITITSSNNLETPNDHILFEKLGKTVFFQDIKTHQISQKNISSFAFIQNMGRIYNIYDLYKEIYHNELNGNELGIGLSSSNFH